MNNRKFYTCCFIGHKQVDNIRVGDIYSIIEYLIINNNQKIIFNFGSNSQFDDLCFNIVSNFKKLKYKNITINYYLVYKEKMITNSYKKYLLSLYDNLFFIDNNHVINKNIYIVRNKNMINDSDMCIFYYNKEKINGGTKIAYNYAVKNNKKIINIFK